MSFIKASSIISFMDIGLLQLLVHDPPRSADILSDPLEELGFCAVFPEFVGMVFATTTGTFPFPVLMSGLIERGILGLFER